ncbi:MAG: B12-binding domain-containing radical SAM protein, partial [Bacteroides sp.]|nr:B12-binding domain-containing radical SAM protein [Bacteroides sp.]
MRVTLIFPAIGIVGFGNKGYYSGEVSWIHHGLASIGASLKTSGHDVDLIDLRRLDGWQQYEEKLSESNPDYIGVSVSALDLKPALEAIDRAKNLIPRAKIAVGGIQPTMFPEKFIDNPNIDFIVKGEGETAMHRIIWGGDLDDGKIVHGSRENLDRLPFADRELFDYELEMDNPFMYETQKRPMVTMVAGRGCPYKCAYCQPAENSVFGTPYRKRSVDSVCEELAILKEKYNYQSVLFWDDTFAMNPKWIHEFCEKYKGGGDIIANCRSDIVCDKPEMIKELAEHGLETLLIGFESGSQRMLDLIEKGTTVEQNYKAAEICRQYGVKIFGTYMIGLPGETKKDALLTKAMMLGIRPDHKLSFVFTPIPGTKMYEYCEKNDLLLDQDYTD